ncbi:MAG: thioredoxin domain-containing protein [Opitutales bacterium]
MPNRLANESSLYLKQHADNPVDWYPWGDEAFAKAKQEQKPLLVSIGYSSCHWCHVMAHESFESTYVADLMNQHFVCVKVDREERPDVDQIYMEAVQMVAQHGGWPLNVFCFPDGRPFFGGTYFPPEDNGSGMVPWPQLLMRVADVYRREPEKLEENAENIVKNLSAMNTPPAVSGAAGVTTETLTKAATTFCDAHDDDFGGFGSAPKFPPSTTLQFLMQMTRLTSAPEGGKTEEIFKRLDQVTETTLTAMAHGGIYDQIGGGFARYSVDRYWLIPHFEKMLYDNGLLLQAYAQGWQRYRKPLYQAIIEESIAWLKREMTAPSGLFYSSIDADSEGDEGKFTVWSPAEVEAVLGKEEGRRFCHAYNITHEGNFEGGKSNPALVEEDFEKRQSFAQAREKLLSAREKRVRPTTDKKHIVSWNSLMIRGLAEAGFSMDSPETIAMGRRAADFIWSEMRFNEDRLHSVHHHSPAFNGYLDDYAHYGEALLALAAVIDCYDPGASRLYIDRAATVTRAIDKHFADPEAAGYFFTSDDHEELVTRRKEWWDGALPSGNSSLLHLFSHLHILTADDFFRQRFTRQKRAYSGFADRAANGVPHALDALAADTAGIAVLKVKGVTDWSPLVSFIREKTAHRIYILQSSDPQQPEGYQLCVGPTCLQPVPDIKGLMEQL